MSKKRQTYSIELPVGDPEAEKAVYGALNALQDAMYEGYEKETDEIAKQFGVSLGCAGAIFYLRTRSRHSEEAEAELIRMDKAGEELPNIFEWPPVGWEPPKR